MKPKRKDNLTDAVEALDRNDNGDEGRPPPGKPAKDDQEVLDNEGNLVTLGQNHPSHPQLPNKREAIELSPEFIKAIKTAVASALDEAIEKFALKLNDKSDNGNNRE